MLPNNSAQLKPMLASNVATVDVSAPPAPTVAPPAGASGIGTAAAAVGLGTDDKLFPAGAGHAAAAIGLPATFGSPVEFRPPSAAAAAQAPVAVAPTEDHKASSIKLLLDVDHTALLPGEGRSSSNEKYNEALFEALKEFGVKDIWLFTNMDGTWQLKQDSKNGKRKTREQLKRELERRGFIVRDVITIYDHVANADDAGKLGVVYRRHLKLIYDTFFNGGVPDKDQQHNPDGNNGFIIGDMKEMEMKIGGASKRITFSKACEEIDSEFLKYEKRQMQKHLNFYCEKYKAQVERELGTSINPTKFLDYIDDILMALNSKEYPFMLCPNLVFEKKHLPAKLVDKINRLFRLEYRADNRENDYVRSFFVNFINDYRSSKDKGFAGCKGHMAELFFEQVVKPGDHVIHVDDDPRFLNTVGRVYENSKISGVTFTAVHRDDKRTMVKEDYLRVLREGIRVVANQQLKSTLVMR